MQFVLPVLNQTCSLIPCPLPGDTAKLNAWVIRRLVTEFNRSARRGHYPREKLMRLIYEDSGIGLPENPRGLTKISLDNSCSH